MNKYYIILYFILGMLLYIIFNSLFYKKKIIEGLNLDYIQPGSKIKFKIVDSNRGILKNQILTGEITINELRDQVDIIWDQNYIKDDIFNPFPITDLIGEGLKITNKNTILKYKDYIDETPPQNFSQITGEKGLEYFKENVLINYSTKNESDEFKNLFIKSCAKIDAGSYYGEDFGPGDIYLCPHEFDFFDKRGIDEYPTETGLGECNDSDEDYESGSGSPYAKQCIINFTLSFIGIFDEGNEIKKINKNKIKKLIYSNFINF